MAFAFEKLIVYQKSVDFADAICAQTEKFIRGYGFLADQLNRAALSIAANIAEGNGRFTKADRRNFFGIARGSAQECVPLLELSLRRNLIDLEAFGRLKSQLEEIARMLSGLISRPCKSDLRRRVRTRDLRGNPIMHLVPPRVTGHCQKPMKEAANEAL